MARIWSVSLLLLLTLPMAVPATSPIQPEARWDGAPPLVYRARGGETLAGLADRASGNRERLRELAVANGLSPKARLRAGQRISIPASMVRRELLEARVVSFAGEVTTGSGAALALGSTLGEGDIIRTGPNSFVTLDMGAAGRMTLPSQTRMRIAALHRVAMTGEVVRRLDTVEDGPSWLAYRRDMSGAGGRG